MHISYHIAFNKCREELSSALNREHAELDVSKE